MKGSCRIAMKIFEWTNGACMGQRTFYGTPGEKVQDSTENRNCTQQLVLKALWETNFFNNNMSIKLAKNLIGYSHWPSY